MKDVRLAVPAVTDSEWRYSVPNVPLPRGYGRFIVFKSDVILFRTGPFTSNRILRNDDPSKFISVSFREFRMPEYTTVDYIKRFLAAGLFLDDRQYRFYHHSPSQLRERGCFLREAASDEELDARIYSYGDFSRINNVAKRAKRIGLLFSGASIDYNLDPQFTEDIDDIIVGNELFSDGCGLVSRRLAVALSRQKKIVFRGARYTPSVFQIRYRGYKGVLMLHPELDRSHGPLAQFRRSMKKFNATLDDTFTVVGYSTPYAFGRLNNDVIVLISSLGITNETLLAKQAEYFDWLLRAVSDVSCAVDLLSCLGDFAMAERVLLDGLDADHVQKALAGIVSREVKSFRKDNGRLRSRMIIRKSRLLFGVCDPFGVLREGEVHVRVSAGRQPATTLTHCDVLVVKNPCLHPGDVLKLHAVENPRLAHLVDCVVFPSVGKRAPASMTSGSDLDGDQFFVCWDSDIIPSKTTDPYLYPKGKEQISRSISRQDLAAHFAAYSGASIAKVAGLHSKWARHSQQGAMCTECLELSALHSLAVDGGKIKVPKRLTEPPEGSEPYIIDELAKAAQTFAETYLHSAPVPALSAAVIDRDDAAELIGDLLGSTQHALPEWDLVQRCIALARARKIEFSPFLAQIDYGSLSTQAKYALSAAIPMDATENARLWNSLFQSDVLNEHDLRYRNLDRPIRFQRLYSSRNQGRAAFFEYLHKATRDYTRKLIIMKIDDRIAVGLFIKGNIAWEDIPVDDDVVVCSFEFQSSHVMSTYRECPPGFRLHCRGGRLQLYEKNVANTFVFITRPPPNSGQDIIASVALQKFSREVQRQIGRVNRMPVRDLEIHVISNRDRVAHQAFDLRFEHVQTEEVLRETKEPRHYQLASLAGYDWTTQPSFANVFSAPRDRISPLLRDRSLQDLDDLMSFAVSHRADEHVFWIFEHLLSRNPFPVSNVLSWIITVPELCYVVLKRFEFETETPHAAWDDLGFTVLRGIIRCATVFGIASLVALEKLGKYIAALQVQDYADLMYLAANCVRGQELARELLLVLHEQRGDSSLYYERQILTVACDRMEEAFDKCPCDDAGRVRRRDKGIRTRLSTSADDVGATIVKADVRVDKPSTVRLHSHVRIQAELAADGPHVHRLVLDGVVIEAPRGELKIKLFGPLPPELPDMDWDIFDAGSVATTKAMLDAIVKLRAEGKGCCALAPLIDGTAGNEGGFDQSTNVHPWENDGHLNEGQLAAVKSVESPLSLIWGPPGTGKTTVVLSILELFLRQMPDCKILMAASTHNAVDNVLERFATIAAQRQLLDLDHVLRISTDVSKVNRSLLRFTIDAMLGGSPTDDPRLVKRAQTRVESARIVFTTCSGAGLGLLRNVSNFDIVVIDEASQVTEAGSLIPLVKGCRRAVLVGDHVQLRPMTRDMSSALMYDVSLMERLYRGPEHPAIRRTMLDVQYRFPAELARFPSEEFYGGLLRTGPQVSPALPGSFPWPRSRQTGQQLSTVFVQCASEEEMGRAAKTNEGQAAYVRHIVRLIMDGAPADMTLAVLTPYAAQQKLLRAQLPASVACSSIDGFQGREADVVVFCTVRCNVMREIGFLHEARRLNVVWTRARYALVVVGDADTLRGAHAALRGDSEEDMAKRDDLRGAYAMWDRALKHCVLVQIELPEELVPR
ncbi:RNA-directed RNA polymerase [Auricularia subglabra TFB-10046 SS5]|nr:RNA-directed RNA polymerase [Auricularia subglabra TFB-10046 SS5]